MKYKKISYLSLGFFTIYYACQPLSNHPVSSMQALCRVARQWYGQSQEQRSFKKQNLAEEEFEYIQSQDFYKGPLQDQIALAQRSATDLVAAIRKVGCSSLQSFEALSKAQKQLCRLAKQKEAWIHNARNLLHYGDVPVSKAGAKNDILSPLRLHQNTIVQVWGQMERYVKTAQDALEVNTVKQLYGMDFEETNTYNQNLLHLIAQAGDEEAMIIILKAPSLYIRINHVDYLKRSPLHYAARNGNTAIIQGLIHRNAQVNILDNHGYTPLYYAIQATQNPEAVLALINAGASLTGLKGRYTYLHCAAEYGNLAVVQYLVTKKSMNANAKDENKRSPLHYAAQHGHVRIVQVLLDFDADADAQDFQNQTPLVWACLGGHYETAKTLLRYHSDINLSDQNKKTPLHWAIQKKYTSISELLINNGAKVNVADLSQETPLHYAIIHHQPLSLIKLIIANKADVNAVSAFCYTPLHQAVVLDKSSIIHLLLNNDAKVHGPTGIKVTPLALAAQQRLINIELLLKQYGAKR